MNRLSIFIGASILASTIANVAWAQAVSDTSFTYQGLLEQNGTGVTQQCDFEFSLWTGNNAPDPGVQVGSDVSLAASVNEGIFTAELDFGADALNGTARWLNIAVCCPSGCAPAYSELVPRQALTSAPYSVQTRGIFVDDNLKVGIGTASPNALLTVGEGDEAAIQVGQSPQLQLSKDTAGDRFRVQLAGSGYSSNTLQIGRDDAGHDIELSGDVDIVGAVGIGLGAEEPISLLHVGLGAESNISLGMNPRLLLDKATHDQAFRIQLSGTGFGDYILQLGRDDGGHDIHLSGDVDVLGTAWFTEKVGIGVNPPSVQTVLHTRVTGDDFGVLADAGNGNGSQIGLHSGTAGFASLAKNAYFNSGWQRFDTSSGAYLQEVEPDGDTTFNVAPSGANPIDWNRAMVIKPTGQIGIGTNNPEKGLHVNGSVIVEGMLDFGLEVVYVASFSRENYPSCPSGKVVIGGGCNCLDGEDIQRSYPDIAGNAERWACICTDDSTGAFPHQSYAFCARAVRGGHDP